MARNKEQCLPDVVGGKEGFYRMLPPPEHDGDDGAATAVNKTPICPRVAASWLGAIISSCPDPGLPGPGDRDMVGVTTPDIWCLSCHGLTHCMLHMISK